jgi:RNA polymerase sigma factor (sigma-70 family)
MTPLLAHRLRPDRSFERLYRRHAADVYRYALAMLRNPADAEDVTQTTFLNAYRAYQGGERPRAAQNWLITIAHNVCRQRFRQQQRRVQEVSFDESSAGAHAPDEDVPRAADLQRALGNLGFNQRAALVMRELEGRSYREIGEVLGLSTSAVETLIFRARRALREQLEGSLTCAEAERAISRQLDGRLPRSEKGALRAHLRGCGECSSVARRHRAQRAAFRGLAVIPLPTSLTSLFGFGGGAAGGSVAVKAAAVLAVGVMAGGTGYVAVKHDPLRPSHRVAPSTPVKVAPTSPSSQSKATPRNSTLPRNLTVAQVVRSRAVAPPKRHATTAPARPRERAKTGPIAAKAPERTVVPAPVVAPARPLPTPPVERYPIVSGDAGTKVKPARLQAGDHAGNAKAGSAPQRPPQAIGRPATKPEKPKRTGKEKERAKPKPSTKPPVAGAVNGAVKKQKSPPAPVATAPPQPAGAAPEQSTSKENASNEHASKEHVPPGQEKKAEGEATAAASDAPDVPAATPAPELAPGQSKVKLKD